VVTGDKMNNRNKNSNNNWFHFCTPMPPVMQVAYPHRKTTTDRQTHIGEPIMLSLLMPEHAEHLKNLD
jgi:hypothetical protein